MTDEPRQELTPEQQKQMEEALAKGRAALQNVSKAGCLAFVFRGLFGSIFRFPRFGLKKFLFFGIGLLIAALSILTWSASVDLQKLTAEYGEPVRPTKDAAERFVRRTAAAIQSAPNTRRLRITVTETEATSALSLGLMMPELMRAMDSVPPEEFQRVNDIEGLRALLREREAARKESHTFGQKIAGFFDPELRTGDVQVQFTGNGEIVAAGYVQAWRWKQPALVVFAPSARSGELELDFVKGRLGRIPAPAFAFDLLGRLVASLMLQGREYAEITNLTVQEGRMVFEGVVR